MDPQKTEVTGILKHTEETVMGWWCQERQPETVGLTNVSKLGDLSSILGTHVVEGTNRLTRVVL